MTEIFEHDQKLTITNMNLLNISKKFNKIATTVNMNEYDRIIFGQIQSFSVEFNKLTFVVVIFRSC